MGVERVWVHPEAIEEARAAYQWYRERSPEIADAFMSELDRGMELISEEPHRFAPYVAGTRRCINAGFHTSSCFAKRVIPLRCWQSPMHVGVPVIGAYGDFKIASNYDSTEQC